jgi:16S rRNA G966 N2-methylase RsmD
MDKRDFLFKFLPKTIRSQLRLDNEALYSVTDQLTADKITQEILHYVPSTAIITDGTACVGGNTFSLSRAFQYINAVELDKLRFHYLKHNMKLLGVENITFYKADLLKIVSQLEQDLIFIDPPWGGPEYKTKDKIDLELSGIPLADVCIRLSTTSRFIALKTPVNFNAIPFLEKIKSHWQLIHSNTKLRKLHFYLLERHNPPTNSNVSTTTTHL